MINYENCSIVYIYALTDPITSEVRYVGQAIQSKKRYQTHISRAITGRERNHKACWIKGLIDKNLKPILKLLESCDADIAHDREDYWINHYRERNHKITNLEAPAKTPGLNRLQTTAEINKNRAGQLVRNQNDRAIPYHGVHICNPKSEVPYRASLRIKTVRHHLGQWDNPKDAAKAWDSAMAYYFPEHKIFNFPNEVVPKSIEEIKKTTTSAARLTSQYKGVSLVKKSGLFALLYNVHGVRTKVGSFKEEETAAIYYDSLELYYNPDKPKFNFPGKPNKPLSAEEVRKISRQMKGLSATQTSQYKNILYKKREKHWAFEVNKYVKGGFKTELEAVRGFNNYITTNYINRPILIIK